MNRALMTRLVDGTFRKVKHNVLICTLSAFGFGMIVYAYAALNITLCTGDALTNVRFNGNLVWLGRWSSVWLSAPSGEFSVPLIAVGLTVLYLSAMSGVICSILQLKTLISVVLCGVVVLAHPSVGNILKYTHNTDAYQLAALLVTVSIWLAEKKPFRLWFIPAIILLGVATGTYQAVLSFGVAIMAISALTHILRDEESDAVLACLALRYFILFIGGLLVYLLGVVISTKVTGIMLTDYQSVSRMGQFSFAELLRNIKLCFFDFKNDITYISCRDGWFVSGYFNYALFLAVYGLLILQYLCKQKKGLLRTSIFTLLLLTLPLLLCSIRLTNPSVVDQRMTYSTVGLFLLPVICVDLIHEKPNFQMKKIKKLFSWFTVMGAVVSICCLCVALFGWSVGINLDFFRGKQQYDRMNNVCNSYSEMAIRTKGYKTGMPIYIAGKSDNTIGTRLDYSKPKYYYAFMYYYQGADLSFGIANDVDDATVERMHTEIFEQMPVYPQDGCSRVIDGAIVIKLGPTPS